MGVIFYHQSGFTAPFHTSTHTDGILLVEAPAQGLWFNHPQQITLCHCNIFVIAGNYSTLV